MWIQNRRFCIARNFEDLPKDGCYFTGKIFCAVNHKILIDSGQKRLSKELQLS